MKKPRAFFALALGVAVFGLPAISGAQAPLPIASPNRTPAVQLVPPNVPPPGHAPVAARPPVAAAAPAADEEKQAMFALIAEIAAQQALMAEQQQVIDAKLTVIAENLRIARIYVSRGGGASASPK